MQQNFLTTVQDALLAPANLSKRDLALFLQKLSGPCVDIADLYFQYLQAESWFLEDGIIKDANFHLDQGVGVRAVSGTKTGFAYSDEISHLALEKAVTAARSIAEHGQEGKVKAWQKNKPITPILYTQTNPLSEFSEKDKVALLHKVYAEVKRQDRRVIHATVNLSGSFEMILIAASDGKISADIRPLVRLNVSVVLADKSKREHGSYGGGGRCSYQFFMQDDRALTYAREAVRGARINLEAIAAPAGNMPVVLGSGWAGVLLHEAIGHGLEADFNRKGSSVFTNKIGQRVATAACTVIDQGNLPGEHRGSLHIDDEGTATQKTVLIENGILRAYLQDKLNARLMQSKLTGNGRRESYSCVPLPRMTNTYMLSGNYSKDEIIASVEKGLYAVNFSGGEVDITSGKFVFTTSEAYLIEKGKVTRPVKNAALIGNGPDVLTKVSLVGNDLALDNGVGTCGKDGQSVPVGVGQPTLKVDVLTVGGTESS